MTSTKRCAKKAGGFYPCIGTLGHPGVCVPSATDRVKLVSAEMLHILIDPSTPEHLRADAELGEVVRAELRARGY